MHLHLSGKTLVNTLDIFHAREHLWAFAAAQFVSGIIEDACKTMLKQSLSASGMRRTRPRAQTVATLRALHRSHQWDAWWRTQPHRRLSHPSPNSAA